jgi:hypothetical protein
LLRVRAHGPQCRRAAGASTDAAYWIAFAFSCP